MKSLKYAALLMVFATAMLSDSIAHAFEKTMPNTQRIDSQRIVFIGDSITDGHTYPLMVQQALRESGAPVPVVINAGIGGDTAEGMSQRIERDVLVHKPTLVTLSAGINDASRKVPLAEYSASVTAIADRLRAVNVPLIILTTSVYSAKHAEAEKRTDEYNAWLKEFAAQRNLQVVEVNAVFKRVRIEKGDDFFMEPDGIHPNWQGQRLIARAVLDALGYRDAVVPQTLQLAVMPGVLSPWRLRATPEKPVLSDEAARRLTEELTANPSLLSGKEWREYSLPEATSQAHPWLEQERQRGFALSLDKALPGAKRVQGVTILDEKSTAPRQVFFNTGGHVHGIWLNGERIYQNREWRGWHAGHERIAATFKPGRNLILMESGTQFFLSVTPDNNW